jgi:hypothetical protein
MKKQPAPKSHVQLSQTISPSILVHDSGLPAFLKNSSQEAIRIDSSFQNTPFDKIHFWKFRAQDIEEFERKHQELLSPPNKKGKDSEPKSKANQRHKERCRALAEYLWSLEKNKGTTIADMIKSDPILTIGCERNVYDADTLRDWIKDLCPNRNPGRRKND